MLERLESKCNKTKVVDVSIYIFEKLWISKYDIDLDSKIHSNIGLDFK